MDKHHCCCGCNPCCCCGKSHHPAGSGTEPPNPHGYATDCPQEFPVSEEEWLDADQCEEAVGDDLDIVSAEEYDDLLQSSGLPPIRGGARGPEEDREGGGRRPGARRRPAERRKCLYRWVVSSQAIPQPADLDSDGSWGSSQHSYMEKKGVGASHSQRSRTLYGNCFTSEWSKSTQTPGLQVVRMNIVPRPGSEGCPACTGTVYVEGYYRSVVHAHTSEGMTCWPIKTNRSSSLAVDWARLIVNGTTVMNESGGAQSGSTVSTTISGSIGAQYTTSPQGPSTQFSVSLSSSETRNVGTGAADDNINGTGSRKVTTPCSALLPSGGRTNLTTNGRAAGHNWVTTQALAIFCVGISNCAGAGNTYFAVVGGYNRRERGRLKKLFNGFAQQHGFDPNSISWGRAR